MGLRGPVRWEQAGPQDMPAGRTPAPSSQSRSEDGAGRAGGSKRSPHTRTGECFFLVLAGRAAVAALFLLFISLFYFMKTVQYFLYFFMSKLNPVFKTKTKSTEV